MNLHDRLRLRLRIEQLESDLRVYPTVALLAGFATGFAAALLVLQ